MSNTTNTNRVALVTGASSGIGPEPSSMRSRRPAAR